MFYVSLLSFGVIASIVMLIYDFWMYVFRGVDVKLSPLAAIIAVFCSLAMFVFVSLQ